MALVAVVALGFAGLLVCLLLPFILGFALMCLGLAWRLLPLLLVLWLFLRCCA